MGCSIEKDVEELTFLISNETTYKRGKEQELLPSQ